MTFDRVTLCITTVSLVLHCAGILSHNTVSGLGQTCEYETECKYSSIAHAVSSIDSC